MTRLPHRLWFHHIPIPALKYIIYFPSLLFLPFFLLLSFPLPFTWNLLQINDWGNSKHSFQLKLKMKIFRQKPARENEKRLRKRERPGFVWGTKFRRNHVTRNFNFKIDKKFLFQIIIFIVILTARDEKRTFFSFQLLMFSPFRNKSKKKCKTIDKNKIKHIKTTFSRFNWVRFIWIWKCKMAIVFDR